MRVEFFDMLKLKTAYFQNINIVLVLQKCLSKTIANIPCQASINSAIRKQVMREHCCGCFAIAPRNTY